MMEMAKTQIKIGANVLKKNFYIFLSLYQEEKNKKERKKKDNPAYDPAKIKAQLQAKQEGSQASKLGDGGEAGGTSDEATTPTETGGLNHLQVMAAIDGSNSASQPSLASVGNNVGNGHIRPSGLKSPSKDEAATLLIQDELEGSSKSNAKRTDLNSDAGKTGSLQGQNAKADTKRRKSIESIGSAEPGLEGPPGGQGKGAGDKYTSALTAGGLGLAGVDTVEYTADDPNDKVSTS